MPEQTNAKLNAKEVKEKILSFLNMVGPSLPVQVAKHMNMNSIFASAFLSEMASDGMIKISDMKVGGSPLYYPQNKIDLLENFIKSLGGKEREACLLLKENGILDDSSQHPAIRVALRSLKDFAFPFKKDEKIFWRYFLVSEEEVKNRLEKPIEKQNLPEVKIEISPEEAKIAETAKIIIEQQTEKNNELENINRELENKKRELEQLKQELSSRINEKSDIPIKLLKKNKGEKKLKVEDNFLNEIKAIIEKKQMELISIESFDKKQVFAKIKINGKEHLLAAYNKKKPEDIDLIKAYKKAMSQKIPYYILSRGEVSKKTKEAIDAYKQLASIDKIE